MTDGSQPAAVRGEQVGDGAKALRCRGALSSAARPWPMVSPNGECLHPMRP
jgi:hypothetical protein